MDEENLLIKKSVDEFLSKNSERYEVISDVYNLTQETFPTIVENIKNHRDLFFKDHPSSIFFFFYIIQSSKFNFKLIELYADLLVIFKSDIQNANVTESEMITISVSFSSILTFLFDRNFFSIASIIEKSRQSTEIFITFLPEIEKYDREYAQKKESILFEKYSDDNKKLEKYYKFVKSNPEQHIYYRSLNYHPSPIHKSIRDDDVEALQSLLSKNNYDINYRIEYSFYERLKMLLDEDLSLIQVAAFYGSVNVFKFLMMQKNIVYDDNLLSYAYAGQNFEIIHLCENVCSLENACNQTILIHRQDLLDYFIDNFPDKIEEKDENLKEVLKKFQGDEDNEYEMLSQDCLASSLFSLNFDIIKPCLRKMAFISRNYEIVEKYIYSMINSPLIRLTCFDFELFKLFYSLIDPKVDKSRCKIFDTIVGESVVNGANDVFKFLFSELKSYKVNSWFIWRLSMKHNHDIANFILDYKLSNKNDENEYGFTRDFQIYSNSILYCNEDFIIKIFELHGIDISIIDLFVYFINDVMPSQKILDMVKRLLVILPKEVLLRLASSFQSYKMDDAAEMITQNLNDS